MKTYPLPETRKPETRWRVEGIGPGQVPNVQINGKAECAMRVPLDDTQRAHMARWHELLHVEYTPQRLIAAMQRAHIKPIYANSVEDLRIGLIAARELRRPVALCLKPEETKGFANKLVDANGALDPNMAAIFVSVCHQPEDALRLLDDAPGPIAYGLKRIASEVTRILYARKRSLKTCTVKRIVEAARYLQSALEPPVPVSSGGGRVSTPPAGNVQWGDMRIDRAPMPYTVKGAGGLRPSLDTGGLLNPSRLYLDGRVFGMPSRRAGALSGAILLDGSGSMGDNAESAAIGRMLAAVPCATIAVYSGEKLGPPALCGGRLTILAENGKRASGDPHGDKSRENAVDLPALQWLSRQRGPRVWISDGNVVPCIGERAIAGMQCQVVVGSCGIVRVETVDAAIAYFTVGKERRNA